MELKSFFVGSVPTPYAEQLRTEILTCPEADQVQQSDLLKSFAEKGGPYVKTGWDEAAKLETELIRSLPDAQLRLKYVRLRDELDTLAGEEFSARYLASVPVDPSDIEAATLQAHCFDMVARVQRLRIMRQGFNRIRTYVTVFATLIVAGFFYWIVSYFFSITSLPRPNSTFATTMIVLAGMLGACVSALSRLYSISWISGFATGINSISHFFWGLVLNFITSVLQGGLFAVIIYLVFMGNLVSGAIFPSFKEVGQSTYFHEFFEAGLKTHADFAKALIWAFVAGFSERLVPDFLSTLGPQLQSKK
jgi:hypothetical protein